MESGKDYYKILGLSEEDKKLQGEEFSKKLKGNYRKMAKDYHPDRYANKSEEERKEAEEKFKEITEAYDVLSDDNKRMQYDRFGTAEAFDFNGFSGTGMPDIDEILNRFRGGFGSFNPFGDMGMGFGMHRRGNMVEKPEPVKVRVHLTIEDLHKGGVKRIKYKRFKPCKDCNASGTTKYGKTETCPVCGGSGVCVQTERNGWATVQRTSVCPKCHGSGKIITNPCNTCGGTGRVVETEEYDLQIPYGAVDGSMFLVPEMGNYAERNKNVVGDLLVIIAIDNNGKYRTTNGYDLHTTIDVPILECITGGKAEIEFIDKSKFSIKIPRFTRDGAILQLQGYGLPSENGRGRLLVEVRQKYPDNIDSNEEKLLKKLKQSKNFAS